MANAGKKSHMSHQTRNQERNKTATYPDEASYSSSARVARVGRNNRRALRRMSIVTIVAQNLTIDVPGFQRGPSSSRSTCCIGMAIFRWRVRLIFIRGGRGAGGQRQQ